jgi:hypothetical protein
MLRFTSQLCKYRNNYKAVKTALQQLLVLFHTVVHHSLGFFPVLVVVTRELATTTNPVKPC